MVAHAKVHRSDIRGRGYKRAHAADLLVVRVGIDNVADQRDQIRLLLRDSLYQAAVVRPELPPVQIRNENDADAAGRFI